MRKQIIENEVETKFAVLVYQAGIANVFEVWCLNQAPFGRDAKRLLQGCFRECEAFARGMGAAGFKVATMACNEAGDIIGSQWSVDLDSQPFSGEYRPVYIGVENTDNRDLTRNM